MEQAKGQELIPEAFTSLDLLFAMFLALFLLFPTAPLTAQEGPENGQTQSAPQQPIPFSHKKHAEVELPCSFCHENKDPGTDMTFPTTVKCMGCHSAVATEKPAIKRLATYAQMKQEVPWVRVYSVAGFVYWSHRTHLEAKLKCEMCHGEVAQMDVMKRVTNVTTMGGCVECHKQHHANTGCQSCHESQSS